MGNKNEDKKNWKSDYVFVYGTLKKGFWLNDLLRNAEFVGATTTRKSDYALFSHNDAWPGFINGKHRVKGEAYKINPDILASLDRAEGYPDLYDRTLIRVQNIKEPCWVYTASDRLLKVYNEITYNSPFITYDKKQNTHEWVKGERI